MLKIALLLLLVAASVRADDSVQPTIRSVEEAIIRFREARSGELKDSLREDQLKLVVGMSGVETIHAGHRKPSSFPKPDELKGEDILGTVTNVTECKHDIWFLGYSSGYGGHMEIYLDAVTGKVLYIHYAFVCG